MPKPILSVSIDTQRAEAMITSLLRRMENPSAFISQVIKYVKAMTYRMFHGLTPTAGVRGVRWPALKESTIESKMQKGYTRPKRPLWATGEMWQSIKVLYKNHDGFIYGTKLLSKTGFPYPAIHNTGGWVPGRPPKREWLFLTKGDMQTIQKMAIDFLSAARTRL